MKLIQNLEGYRSWDTIINEEENKENEEEKEDTTKGNSS